jgi:hypothetical protein
VGDDLIDSAGSNGCRRHRRRLEVGAVLAVMNGVMVGVGGVYAPKIRAARCAEVQRALDIHAGRGGGFVKLSTHC